MSIFRIILLCTCLLAVMRPGFSQEALTIQNLTFNPELYNTAFTASGDSPLDVSLTSSMGQGIQNTGKFSFLAVTQFKNSGMGLGIKLNSRYFGLFRTTVPEVMASHQIKISESSHLMAGISLGMHFTNLRNDELNDYVDREDPQIANGNFPQSRFTVGAGIGYKFKEKLAIGVSMPMWAKTDNEFYPAYIFNSSYQWELSPSSTFVPQLLVFGTNYTNPDGELSVRYKYTDRFWLRAGGRSTKTWIFGAGVNVKSIRIGYTYQLNSNGYKTVSPAVNHIQLGYRMTRDKSKVARKFVNW